MQKWRSPGQVAASQSSRKFNLISVHSSVQNTVLLLTPVCLSVRSYMAPGAEGRTCWETQWETTLQWLLTEPVHYNYFPPPWESGEMLKMPGNSETAVLAVYESHETGGWAKDCFALNSGKHRSPRCLQCIPHRRGVGLMRGGKSLVEIMKIFVDHRVPRKKVICSGGEHRMNEKQ